MNVEDFLVSTIHDYENGGLKNGEFLKKAHGIYNSYANFSCSLPSAEHPYLLGIVFAGFAKYYARNINCYASIIENALFCFSTVMKESESCSERQCAAIRMLLLIDDNNEVMRGIAHKFYQKNYQELYGHPFAGSQFISRVMGSGTIETDILNILGRYCIEKSDLLGKHSSISSLDMRRFNDIKKGEKYGYGGWSLATVSAERVFNSFFEFIEEIIRTPYDRRVTQLFYNGE